jgi:hypothetical protein
MRSSPTDLSRVTLPSVRSARRSFRAALLSITLVAAALVVPRDAGAQTASPGGDSAQLRRTAVAAVHAFEAAAFHYWPSAAQPCVAGRGSSGCAGGWCEAIPGRGDCAIGRSVPCPRYSTTAVPPYCESDARTLGNAFRTRDSVQIYGERDALLRTLADLARRIPGDGWVTGQRVYYLVSANRYLEALRAIGECGAEPAWCELLAGYTHFQGGRAEAAAVSFENALNQLTPESRCDWRDIGMLLSSAEFRAAYAGFVCGTPERLRFEERFWWLSDPSWLVEGNDRRSAHYARVVESKLNFDWYSASCDSCAQLKGTSARPTILTNDAEIIKTGPNDSWYVQYSYGAPARGRGGRGGTRGGGGGGAGRGAAAGGGGGAAAVDTTGGRRGRAAAVTEAAVWTGPSVFRRSMAARYHFVPLDNAVLSPFTAVPGDWRPTGGPPIGLAPRLVPDSTSRVGIPERYTPNYAGLVIPVARMQTGIIRRGDSALVVGAFDLSRDPWLTTVLDAGNRSAFTWSTGLIGFGRPDRNGVPQDVFEFRRDSAPSKVWTGMVRAPWDSSLVGFEILGAAVAGARVPSVASNGVLARARFSVSPPAVPRQRVQLSDLFMTVRAEDSPRVLGDQATLDALIPAADVDSGSVIGLYWEEYGLTANDRPRVRLSLTRPGVRRGILGEIARTVARSGDEVMDQSWTESAVAADRNGVVPRSAKLDLRGFEPGEYDVHIRVSVGGQQDMTLHRHLSINR